MRRLEMPSLDEIILEIERKLLPIIESRVLEMKHLDIWVDHIRFSHISQAAKALKYVETKLVPAFHQYKFVYHLNTPEKWVLLQALDSTFDEVKTLKKVSKEVQKVWTERPKFAVSKKKKKFRSSRSSKVSQTSKK